MNLRASIMRNQEWYSTLAELYPPHFAQLVLGLFARDAVDGEAALGIVDEAEVLTSLLDGDHILEAGWVGRVGAYFAVDFDEALHDDGFCLATIEGVLETMNCMGQYVDLFSEYPVLSHTDFE